MLSGITALSNVPCMLQYELEVATTAQEVTLTPNTNKSIVVYGYWAHQSVSVNATVTEEAKLFFGTDETDLSKRIASYEQETAGDNFGIALSGLNLCGAVNEVVTLRNAAFTVGAIKTAVILYYGNV